jgi:O-antigen/teichoic acid export membrane protein
MIVAVVCIPVIVRHVGTERFGMLNLAWMIIGYFTLFDLGLGRALTKLVAEKLGRERQHDLPALVWTASVLMVGLGVAGGVVLGLLSPHLVTHTFKVPPGMRQEMIGTLYLLAAAIPLVISTIGLRGILEAHQRFDLSIRLRVFMGFFTFIGPLAVLPFSNNLFWITLALVGGRLIAWCGHFYYCLQIMPGLKSGISMDRSMIRPLLKFGGWMTVSNVISPLMVSLDRFLIGALISMAAVAYYSTPWEIVTKFLVIPGAVVGVLFPAFSAAFAQDSHRAGRLFLRGLKYVFYVLFPLMLVVVSFAKEGLHIWLGPVFAENGFRVMQLLAIGILANGVASIPFAFIQGMGRPDVTAKFHLVEAAFYFPCTWWLVKGYGPTGAAFAWALRAGIDALFLLFYAKKFLVEEHTQTKIHVVCAVTSVGVLILAMGSLPFAVKLPIVGFVLTAFLLMAWYWGIDVEERAFVDDKVKTILKYFQSVQ